jgi:hypothetical protein
VITESQLIARQAMEIETLKDQVDDYEKRMARIHMEITGIGGPLNDNVLRYTNQQLGPFSRILDAVQYGCPALPGGGK